MKGDWELITSMEIVSWWNCNDRFLFLKEINCGPVFGLAVCAHLGGDFRALRTATWKRVALLLSKAKFVILYQFQHVF